MKKLMEMEVMTPERNILLRTDIVYVLAEAVTGGIGVLADHAPLIAVLKEGPLKVEDRREKFSFYYVEGGFMEVEDNKVTILTPKALELTELNEAELQDRLALDKGRLEHPTATTDIPSVERDICRITARLKTIDLAKQEQTIVF